MPQPVSRLTLEALGTRVALEVMAGDRGPGADRALLERLTIAWSRCIVGDGTVAASVRVALGATEDVDVANPDPDALMVATTQAVTHAFIHARRGELLLLHAGAVSHPTTGEAVAFVAPGGTGKSTLTLRLARHYCYLTDETTGITPDGEILPYPKPLSLRRDDAAHKDEVSPDSLGLRAVAAPPRLRKLVLLQRRSGLTDVDVEQLSTIDALIGLAPETSSLDRLPRPLHLVSGLLAGTGGAERWTYSEHEAVLPLVDDLLGAP